MRNLRVGKVAITPKGEWKDGVSYEMLDAVYYNGDSYISVSDRNKSNPTDDSSWKILAKGSMDGVKVVNREWFGVFDNKNNFFTIDDDGSVTYASYAANPSEIIIKNPIRIEFDGDNYQTRVYICKRDEVQGGGQPIEIDTLSTRNGKYVFEFIPNDEERKYIRIGIICSGVVNVKVSELFIMTSAYIYNGINSKVDKSDIVQSTGTSTTSVMSQKASTMAFAANTPSGDPMHNMYVAMGAVWNGSGVDKTYPTPWADYAEEEEDKVYVHKTDHWAYCYVGDLTSKDMADIAILPKIYHAFPPFFAGSFKGRAYASNISNSAALNLQTYTKEYKSGFQTFFNNKNNEVIVLFDTIYNPFHDNYVFDDSIYTFAYTKLRCIWGAITLKGKDIEVFVGSKSLKFVFLHKLGINVSFKDCPKLSRHCVQYMIEKATDATITITLHPEAYERAIADAGVQTALTNKKNVSLAKGE